MIVGVRPEHLEDANVEGDEHPDRMRFRTKVDVVESMGSEIYIYFDVHRRHDHAELNELAADAGLDDLASHGDGRQTIARLSPASSVRRGGEVELSVDTRRLAIFA